MLAAVGRGNPPPHRAFFEDRSAFQAATSPPLAAQLLTEGAQDGADAQWEVASRKPGPAAAAASHGKGGRSMMRRAANSREDDPHQVLEPPERPAKPAWASASEAIRKAAAAKIRALHEETENRETENREAPPAETEHEPPTENQKDDKPRANFLQRNPFLIAVGVALFVVIAAAGYLYWDNARRFETTDDAFIEARQFSVAPKVGGLPHGGAGDRQPARRGEQRHRADRRARLPHRAPTGRSAGRRRGGQCTQHRCANGRSEGPGRSSPGAGRAVPRRP